MIFNLNCCNFNSPSGQTCVSALIRANTQVSPDESLIKEQTRRLAPTSVSTNQYNICSDGQNCYYSLMNFEGRDPFLPVMKMV